MGCGASVETKKKRKAQDADGCRGLHDAAANGDLVLLRTLIDEQGAELETALFEFQRRWRCLKNTGFPNPFQAAAENGQVEAAQMLLEAAGDKKMKLLCSKSKNDETTAKSGVKSGGFTALHMAAVGRHWDMTKWLLDTAGDKVMILLAAETYGGFRAFDSAALRDWALAHFLLTYPPNEKPRWGAAETISEDPNHLVLGLDGETAKLATKALGFPENYVRNEDKLGWVTKAFGSNFIGYDLCAAIKEFFRKEHYEKFSVTEVLQAAGHPCVGKADAFFSHAQKEPLEITFECMQRYEVQREKRIKFFLDYFCLRQCQKDFDPPLVKRAIGEIGATVALAEPWSNPFFLTRSFCILEVYSTVDEGATLEVMPPLSQVQPMLECISAGDHNVLDIDVCCKDAQTRDPEDKKKIDDDIEQGPGHEKVDDTARGALRAALLEQAIRNGIRKVKFDLTLDVLTDKAIGPKLAQKVLTAHGDDGRTMLHMFGQSENLCSGEQFRQIVGLCEDPRNALGTKEKSNGGGGATVLKWSCYGNRRPEIKQIAEEIIGNEAVDELMALHNQGMPRNMLSCGHVPTPWV